MAPGGIADLEGQNRVRPPIDAIAPSGAQKNAERKADQQGRIVTFEDPGLQDGAGSCGLGHGLRHAAGLIDLADNLPVRMDLWCQGGPGICRRGALLRQTPCCSQTQRQGRGCKTSHRRLQSSARELFHLEYPHDVPVKPA